MTLKKTDGLYKQTLHTHHDAQTHPFGKNLRNCELSRYEWADWLVAQYQIYNVIDDILPSFLKRKEKLASDILMMLPEYKGHQSEIVNDFLYSDKDFFSTDNVYDLWGLVYLMIGINIRGGQVIAPLYKEKEFPCSFIDLSNDKTASAKANEWLKNMREISSLAEMTNKSYIMMINVMEEIHQRYHNDY